MPLLSTPLKNRVQTFLTEAGAPPRAEITHNCEQIFVVMQRRREDDAFWARLTDLVRELVDSVVQSKSSNAPLPPEAKFLALWDVNELALLLRAALPHDEVPSGVSSSLPPANRWARFSNGLSANSLGLCLLLSLAASACGGEDSHSGTAAVGGAAGGAIGGASSSLSTGGTKARIDSTNLPTGGAAHTGGTRGLGGEGGAATTESAALGGSAPGGNSATGGATSVLATGGKAGLGGATTVATAGSLAAGGTHSPFGGNSNSGGSGATATSTSGGTLSTAIGGSTHTGGTIAVNSNGGTTGTGTAATGGSIHTGGMVAAGGNGGTSTSGGGNKATGGASLSCTDPDGAAGATSVRGHALPPSCCVDTASALWQEIDSSTLDATQKQDLYACFVSLNATWCDGLVDLFKTATPDVIAQSLSELLLCCRYVPGKLSGDFATVRQDVINRMICSVALYKGVTFPS
jgi:hypothetical protein